jgi:hypothetical protein
MVYRSPVVSAAYGLLFFYWTLLFVYFVWTSDWSIADGWVEYSASQATAIACGAAFGLSGGLAIEFVKRRLTLIKLEGDEVRGVACSLGPMPVVAGLPRAKELPDTTKFLMPQGVLAWYPKWRKSLLAMESGGVKVGAPYVRLVDAVMLVMAAEPGFPAGVKRVEKQERDPFLLSDGGVSEPVDEKKRTATKRTESADATEPNHDRIEAGSRSNDDGQRNATGQAGGAAVASDSASPGGHVEEPGNGFWLATTLDRLFGQGGAKGRGVKMQYGRSAALPHGGYTLLEHSHSVASVARQLALDWSFEKAVKQWDRAEKKRNNNRKIGKLNPSYRFNPKDPLITVIALAHDIGKLETFVKGRDGEYTSNQKEHDAVGARMLARLPEFWDLSPKDRRIIQFVISTYHRDEDLRQHKDPVGFSDRIFTLQQLLIRADIETGRFELGIKNDDAIEEDVPSAEVDWTPLVWRTFSSLINEANRISSRHNEFRIGQKNVLGKTRPIVILNELSLRDEMERRLPRECVMSARRNQGDTSGLTSLILKALDVNGVLCKQFDKYVLTADNAVWTVEFTGRDKQLDGPIATWKFAVIIDPTVKFMKLCELPNADSAPVIRKPAGNQSNGKIESSTFITTGFAEEIDEDPREVNETFAGTARKSESLRDSGSLFGNSLGNSVSPLVQQLSDKMAGREPAQGRASAAGTTADTVKEIGAKRKAKLRGDGIPGMEEEDSPPARSGNDKGNGPVDGAADEVRRDKLVKALMKLAARTAQGQVEGGRFAKGMVQIQLQDALKDIDGKVLADGELLQMLIDEKIEGVNVGANNQGVIELTINTTPV